MRVYNILMAVVFIIAMLTLFTLAVGGILS
jgi:hypothetical protein